MPTTMPLFAQMLLPVGRCGRRGLLLAAAVLVAAHIVFALLVSLGLVGFYGPVALGFKLLGLWVAIAMSAKRMHDIGYSAWWLLAGTGGLALWSIIISLVLYPIAGLDVLVPGTVWYWLSFTLVALPLLAATLWLHSARGMPADNRFGPLPDGFGMSMPVKGSISGREAAAA